MAIPKFRVGERVRVRKNLIRACYMHEDSQYISAMNRYAGSIVTIYGCTSCRKDGEATYRVEENPFVWDEYLLEPLNESLDESQGKWRMYSIKKVIYNNPATIILWEDGTKTVVKVQDGDVYSKELGFAMCVSKKFFGNQSNFNNVFKKYVYNTEQE